MANDTKEGILSKIYFDKRQAELEEKWLTTHKKRKELEQKYFSTDPYIHAEGAREVFDLMLQITDTSAWVCNLLLQFQVRAKGVYDAERKIVKKATDALSTVWAKNAEDKWDVLKK